jgi:GNAT superfamily N-acetyltransferase
VIGFASFFPHEGDLAVFVTPELTHDRRAVAFEETALEWADARATGPVGFAEWEDEHAVIDRWRARGFEPTSAGYLNFVRPLDPAVDGGPVHLAVAPVGAGDVEDRASVTHAAFDNAHRPLGEYVRDYAGFAASPAYPRGWDLLARDLDGSPASCCIAWPDLRSGAGSFEPVATHPSKQRRGFGRMVLSEGFRRLAAAGHRWAIVGTDVGNDGAKALYRSVGFVPDRTVRIFRRS